MLCYIAILTISQPYDTVKPEIEQIIMELVEKQWVEEMDSPKFLSIDH